jgi:hypothetical protein
MLEVFINTQLDNYLVATLLGKHLKIVNCKYFYRLESSDKDKRRLNSTDGAMLIRGCYMRRITFLRYQLWYR